MATKRVGPTNDEQGSLESLFRDAKAAEPTGEFELADAAASMRSTPVTGDPFSSSPQAGIAQGRLEYVAPDGTPHSRVLRETTTIGRHTDNDIQLLDREVSKAHLVLRRMREGFVLEDLGSANGTLINGMRQTRARLSDNDVIVVGNSVMRFRIEIPRLPPPRDPNSRRLTSIQEAQRNDTSSAFRAVSHTPRSRTGDDDGHDRTTVTLIPDASNENENVFAQAMEPDFRPAESVRDDRQLRRDYERLRVAYNVSNAISLETDLEQLGARIVEGIRDVLPADTIVVMLRDPSLAGGELVTLASYADRRVEVRIPRAIVDRVVSTKRGLLTSDAQRDLQLRRSETVVGQQIRSALCVPLLVQGDVLGVIHLSTSSAAGAYEEKDLALLRAIAQPAGLAVAIARLLRKAEEDAHQRAELSRFLSPALVEKVVSNELNVHKQGDKVQATVLFSDIRGFTSISDGAAPETVVSMLNEYFEAMVEIVFEMGGTLDKFIGDGLMAVWGTPVPGPDDPVLAVRAATRMRAMLETLVNAARRTRGEQPLMAGYGIATGKVIAGAMGARRRQDFTVIGDTVNLSSRLCGQAKPGQILLDENTERICRRAGMTFQALEPRVVKGVARPVPVWQVPREAALPAPLDGEGG